MSYGADDDDDLGLLLQLQKHLPLGIRLKARQHAGRMVVVKQLAAKFQIELIVKLGNTLPDMGGLHRKIFVVIKSDLHLHSPFLCLNQYVISIPFFAAACNGVGALSWPEEALRANIIAQVSGAEPHLDRVVPQPQLQLQHRGSPGYDRPMSTGARCSRSWSG